MKNLSEAEKVLKSKIKEYSAKKAKLQKLEAEVKALNAEIKADMNSLKVEEYEFGSYKAKIIDFWKSVLDSHRLKEENPKMYEEYLTDRHDIQLRITRK